MPITTFRIRCDAFTLGQSLDRNRFDIEFQYIPAALISGKFEVCGPIITMERNRFDTEPRLIRLVSQCGLFDCRPWTSVLTRNRFDCFRHLGTEACRIPGRFDVCPTIRGLYSNRFSNILVQETGGLFVNRFDSNFQGQFYHKDSFDAIGYFAAPREAVFVSRYDAVWMYQWKEFNRFHAISDNVFRIYSGKYASRFDARRDVAQFWPIRFDVAPPEYFALLRNRFDAVGAGIAAFSARKQAFVLPGWRFLAKNIATDELHDLGFINANSETKTLENIVLPDGDYEISVLTSSLFWKNTLDPKFRLISIRPGEEISPLPTVYNLRSSIFQGERTIFWSANRSDVEDCVFGVWYSSTTPVSMNRPPDATIWYSPELTEYQTSFQQTAPCFTAVAAMRTGDEPEIGPAKELFLDWSNTRPRYPDDIMVLDKPLSVFDTAIFTLHEDDQDVTLWA